MTTEERYKELKKGYNLAFALLKEANADLYNYLMSVIKIANKNSNIYDQVVRDLRIDFAKNSCEEYGKFHSLHIDYGIRKEVVTMTYIPREDYSLVFIIDKGGKRKFYQLFPMFYGDFKNDYCENFFLECDLKDDAVKKGYFYAVSVYNDYIDLFKEKVENPNKRKALTTLDNNFNKSVIEVGSLNLF